MTCDYLIHSYSKASRSRVSSVYKVVNINSSITSSLEGCQCTL